MTEYDTPWKEVVARFFPQFLLFFFPRIHKQIDWSRGYQTLDKELQKIVRQGELGRSVADLLFKVWLLSGEEEWILLHVEVQAQTQPNFERRMYRYNYRVDDRYNGMVVSLAILADDDENWRPKRYRRRLWGTGVDFTFLSKKLLDWAPREAQLERNRNPFAAIVLAHLKSRQTQGQLQDRRGWKFRLVRSLMERNLTPEEIRQLFRFIDWVLDLPDAVNDEFLKDVHELEKEKNVTYITYPERRGEKRGRELGEKRGMQQGLYKGIEALLDVRFGDDGVTLMPEIRQIEEGAKLEQILDSVKTAASVEQVRELISQLHTTDNSSPKK